MWARFSSWVVWSVVAAAVVGWALQLGVRPRPVPGSAQVALAAAPAGGDLSRLLGAPPPAPAPVAEAAAPPVPADSRFKLLGVVAPRPGQMAGLALISVDGQTPRAVAVGRDVEPGLRVLRVAHRQVELGAAIGQAPTVSLELPPLPEAARGRPGEPAAAGPAMPGVNHPALPPIGGLPPGAAPQGSGGSGRAAPALAAPGGVAMGAVGAAGGTGAGPMAAQPPRQAARMPAGGALPSPQAMVPAQSAPPPAMPLEGSDAAPPGGSSPAVLR